MTWSGKVQLYVITGSKWEMNELFPRLPCDCNSRTSYVLVKQTQKMLDFTTSGLVYLSYCALKQLIILMLLFHKAV